MMLFLGDVWFDRFLREHTQSIIPTSKAADKYRCGVIDLTTWNHQRDCYMFENNDGEINVESDMHCFLVKKAKVSIFKEGGPRFVVMV